MRTRLNSSLLPVTRAPPGAGALWYLCNELCTCSCYRPGELLTWAPATGPVHLRTREVGGWVWFLPLGLNGNKAILTWRIMTVIYTQMGDGLKAVFCHCPTLVFSQSSPVQVTYGPFPYHCPATAFGEEACGCSAGTCCKHSFKKANNFCHCILAFLGIPSESDMLFSLDNAEIVFPFLK